MGRIDRSSSTTRMQSDTGVPPAPTHGSDGPAGSPGLRRALKVARYPPGVPPYGPRRSNTFAPPPSPPRRRAVPRWLTASLVPAVVGAGVALLVVALTGNLGGDATVIARDPSPLPAAAASVAETAAP